MKTAVKIIVAGALAGAVATAALTAHASNSKKEDAAPAGRDYSAITFDMTDRVLEKMEAKVFTSADGTALNYREYHSPAYSADGAPAAVFVFLHGSGGRGDNNIQQIGDQIATVNFLVSDSAEQVLGDIPYIVIAPQCPLYVDGVEKQWVATPYSQVSYNLDEVEETPYIKAVYELIKDTLDNKNGDRDNVMLGGISMGGYGTWDLAMRYPDMFNAIFPICGGADPTKAELLKDIKIWTFHCDGDGSVPVQGTRDMVEALQAVGADVMYTEFQKKAHNAWMPAMTEETDPYLLEWLFEECMAYTVTLTATEGGEIYKTEEKLRKGDTMRVDIAPDEGYEAESLTVNGEEVQFITDDSGSIYYECVVDGDMDIEASFKALPVAEEDKGGAEKEGLSTIAKVGIAALAVAAVTGVTAIIVSKKKKK